MAEIDLNEALERACAVAEEAIENVFGAKLDTVPYFRHTQESFPYMIWRVADDEIDDAGEEFDIDTFTIIGRLVIGHITSGYKGEKETKLYSWIPTLKRAFAENLGMQSSTVGFEEYMTDLTEARLIRTTGYRELPHSGIQGAQVCAEFVLKCAFETENEFSHL